jgi:glutaredoxin
VSPKRRRRAASIHSVVLYTAHGCHLCEQARGVLDDEGVAYDQVDITGDPALEADYREWLPVVEIDGERAFVYRIPRETLRRRLNI